MGTYTANKNLYMPTVGEQGWGDLMNTNLSTIDNFLKPITVSGSTYTFTGNHVGNQSGGSISATSITNSGTLTSTGKITANGGIGTTSLTTSSTITSTGKITGNGGIGTTSLTTSSTITSTGLITANGGVKGNITGKINISSLGGNSNNLKVCTLACSTKTSEFILRKNSKTSVTLTPSDYTLSKFNTSIINYTTGDSGMRSAFGTTTATVSVTSPASECTYRIVVTNTTDNSNVTSTNVTVTPGNKQPSITFTLNFAKNYTIEVTQITDGNLSSKYNSVNVSAKSVTKYVP